MPCGNKHSEKEKSLGKVTYNNEWVSEWIEGHIDILDNLCYDLNTDSD